MAWRGMAAACEAASQNVHRIMRPSALWLFKAALNEHGHGEQLVQTIKAGYPDFPLQTAIATFRWGWDNIRFQVACQSALLLMQ